MLYKLALLTVLASLMLTAVVQAQVPDDIKIGAIRWDAWFEGAPDHKVLEQPEWSHRAPFFARYDADGKLHLDGDKEHVLHAEVAYARAIGVDYFIFGFYPDTGSWGRNTGTYLKLNRALSTYLRLPDRMGVKFAISLNQLFPLEDLTDIANSLAALAAHPDYIHTENGTLPVFVLAHDGLDWSRFFGSDDKARGAIETLRQVTRARTGKELTLVIQHYDPANAMDTARRYGLDMATAYTYSAPGKKAVEITYDQCALHGRAMWAKAAANAVPYAPNVTLGWDDRPRKSPAVNPNKLEQGPWCALPTPEPLKAHFASAAAFVHGQSMVVPFRTITVYSWNEFAEGGWMAPNMAGGDDWLAMLRGAIGRSRKTEAVELTWPDEMDPKSCPVRTAEKPRAAVLAGCAVRPRLAAGWPCPPGSQAKAETVRAPSGYESLLWGGAWRAKKCG
jgi:hypothetical protein